LIDTNWSPQIVDSTTGLAEDYRRSWLDGLVLDDQLFQQAIISIHRLNSFRGQNFPGEEQILYHLLQRGVSDHEAADCPFDASTRSMRHLAVIGERLWHLILEERKRVSVSAIPFLVGMC
jgi:hypothetical protein